MECHAPARLRLCPSEQGPRHASLAGISRPPKLPAHRALYRVEPIAVQGFLAVLTLLDHHSASGPNRTPIANSENAASQPDALAGPPAASSATPVPHAPNAERPKPTVECSAIVAPRCVGFALALYP